MDVEVSVIVPMYNSENWICRCIDSILDSTFRNFEIICVDDGSTDDTVENLEHQYDDTRIRIIRKQNGGVSSARNTGIENASGKFIVFIDSDDYISDDYIEKLRNSCITADTAICGYSNVSDNAYTRLEAMDFSASLEDYCNLHLLENWSNGVLFSPWNKMFRLDIIRKGSLHFNEEINILEDIDFCLRYLECCNKVNSLSDTLYNYCVRGGALVPRTTKIGMSQLSSF